MKWSLSTLGLLASLLSMSCGQQHLKVTYMPAPDYPFQARTQGLAGAVVVTVGIGTDGKVHYAAGKGDSLFIRAAEENAKGWVFEVPARAQFPLEQQIKYTFKFDKDGQPNGIPRVITDLPRNVEIIGTPAGGDQFRLVSPEPTTAPHSSQP